MIGGKRIVAINSRDFIHENDKKALEALKGIPVLTSSSKGS